MAKGLLGTLKVRLTAQTEEFTRGINGARKKLGGLEKDIKRFRTSNLAGALSVGVLVGGLSRLVTSTADAADEIHKMSIRSGLAMGTLQSLRYASDQLGVSFEAVQGATESLTRRIPQIERGTGDTAVAFNRLGISLRDGSGNLRSMSELFPDIISGLGGIANETDRNAIATQLFGRKASELTPLIAAGGAEVERLTKRAHELGLVMSDTEIGSMVAFKDRMSELKMQVGAAGREIVFALMPAIEQLGPFMLTMAGWINKAVQGWQMLGAKLAVIPPLLRMIWAAATRNHAALAQAALDYKLMSEAADEVIASILKLNQTAGSLPPITLPPITVPNVEDDGRKAARAYFDGLADEWENLRHEVSLAGLGITGTPEQRRQLEEQHALKLLDIEEERLRARHEGGDLTDAELAHSLRELAVRRDIAKTRRRELDTVARQLQQQENINALAASVGALFPSRASGPGSDVGSNAAAVLADKLNIGGMLGSMLIPGLGGILGGAIGGLFGKDQEEQQKQTQALNRIESHTRQTAKVLEMTRQLTDMQRGLFNVPAGFTATRYTPNSGSITVNVSQVVNVSAATKGGDVTTAVVESMRKELGPLLHRELARMGAA